MAGMPEEPTPSPDLFGLTLSQLEEAIGGAFMQQMLDRLSQQAFVGGKRVAVQELPSLPKQAATTVHRVKVSLHGSRRCRTAAGAPWQGCPRPAITAKSGCVPGRRRVIVTAC